MLRNIMSFYQTLEKLVLQQRLAEYVLKNQVIQLDLIGLFQFVIVKAV
jgi:hypothetical protein